MLNNLHAKAASLYHGKPDSRYYSWIGILLASLAILLAQSFTLGGMSSPDDAARLSSSQAVKDGTLNAEAAIDKQNIVDRSL